MIAECTALLVNHAYTEKFYNRLWKALFYGSNTSDAGLWNYDKLMNQHYFCE